MMQEYFRVYRSSKDGNPRGAAPIWEGEAQGLADALKEALPGVAVTEVNEDSPYDYFVDRLNYYGVTASWMFKINPKQTNQ